MIAFVDREWSGEIANRLRGVGRYHASRLVVLSYEPGRERAGRAREHRLRRRPRRRASSRCCARRSIVELGDRHLDDLLTIADPLVVTDLPTLLWSPHGHPEVVDALLRARAGGAARLGRGARPPRDGASTAPARSQRAGLRRRPGVAALDALARARGGAVRPAARCAASCGCSRARDRAPPPRLDASPRCCSSAGWPRAWAGGRTALDRRDDGDAARASAHASRQDVAAAPAGRARAAGARPGGR